MLRAPILKERLDEDGYPERFCCRCEEWWPADREFFFGYKGRHGKEVLHSWCKACWLEYRKNKEGQYRKVAVAV